MLYIQFPVIVVIGRRSRNPPTTIFNLLMLLSWRFNLFLLLSATKAMLGSIVCCCFCYCSVSFRCWSSWWHITIKVKWVNVVAHTWLLFTGLLRNRQQWQPSSLSFKKFIIYLDAQVVGLGFVTKRLDKCLLRILPLVILVNYQCENPTIKEI